MKTKYITTVIAILATVLFCYASTDKVGMFLSIVARITAMLTIGTMLYLTDDDN